MVVIPITWADRAAAEHIVFSCEKTARTATRYTDPVWSVVRREILEETRLGSTVLIIRATLEPKSAVQDSEY